MQEAKAKLQHPREQIFKRCDCYTLQSKSHGLHIERWLRQGKLWILIKSYSRAQCEACIPAQKYAAARKMVCVGDLIAIMEDCDFDGNDTIDTDSLEFEVNTV